MSAALAAVRGPLAQLLTGATRAEKGLKAALEKATKQALKNQAKLQKAKDAEVSQGVPLFDQGAACASAIPYYKMSDFSKADQAQPDLAKPFIVHIDEWVAEAMQEQSGTRQRVDAFRLSFDKVRAQQEGSRASKALTEVAADQQAEFDLEDKLQTVLQGVKGFLSRNEVESVVKAPDSTWRELAPRTACK